MSASHAERNIRSLHSIKAVRVYCVKFSTSFCCYISLHSCVKTYTITSTQTPKLCIFTAQTHDYSDDLISRTVIKLFPSNLSGHSVHFYRFLLEATLIHEIRSLYT
jgi:hypothetical protein